MLRLRWRSGCDVSGKESTNLLGEVIVFGGTEEPAVRHGLEHVQLGIDPAGTKLSVHPNRVGQEQVSGSSLQKGRREGGTSGHRTGGTGRGVGDHGHRHTGRWSRPSSRSARCRYRDSFGTNRPTPSGQLRASAGSVHQGGAVPRPAHATSARRPSCHPPNLHRPRSAREPERRGARGTPQGRHQARLDRDGRVASDSRRTTSASAPGLPPSVPSLRTPCRRPSGASHRGCPR